MEAKEGVAEEVVKARVKVVKNILNTKGQGTLISPLSAVADAIGFLERELTFVKNQGHALGRTSTWPGQINEIQTDSANLLISFYMNCCTTKN